METKQLIDKAKDLFYLPPKSEFFLRDKQVFFYSLLDTCKKENLTGPNLQLKQHRQP